MYLFKHSGKAWSYDRTLNPMLGKVLESLVVEVKKGARGKEGAREKHAKALSKTGQLGSEKNCTDLLSKLYRSTNKMWIDNTPIDEFIHLCFFFIYAYNYQKK